MGMSQKAVEWWQVAGGPQGALFFIACLLSILSFSNFFLVTYDTDDHVSWFARTVLGYACCLYVIVPAHRPLYYQRVLITNYTVRLSDTHMEN